MRISINGQFVDHISLTGAEPEFNYAYGVFETIRTYHSQPFHVLDHLQRLRDSAAELQLSIQEDDATLTRWIELHCTLEAEQRIKIIAAIDNIYIISQPLVLDEQVCVSGVTVKLTALERRSPSIKRLGYAEEYLAHSQAVVAGHHDALLMKHDQEVREGAYSNFFCVKDNVIITPRYEILQGITRNIVLKLVKSHYQIEERKIFIHEVMVVDECFLTQTTTGVVPVVGIDNHVVGDGRPGLVTKHVIELFKEYTNAV